MWPVQSQKWKVKFFVPQATNSIWRRETPTMATPMRSLSVGVAKSVREWFLNRRGRGFDVRVVNDRLVLVVENEPFVYPGQSPLSSILPLTLFIGAANEVRDFP